MSVCPPLAADEIHIWTWRLDDDLLKACDADWLTHEERSRWAGLRTPSAQIRFAAARNGLRFLLAQYLGREPSEIVLTEGRFGKPCLGAEADLAFNLSHARDVAAFAICRGGAVGIDIEAEAAGHIDLYGILSAEEERRLHQLGVAVDRSTLLQIWIWKEAVLKACGLGLSRNPSTLILDFERPDGRLVARSGAVPGLGSYALQGFQPAPGFVGAVASLREGWRMLSFSLCPEHLNRARRM
ncbi:4'-phosphopantetheinyl transferase [Rhodopseudomonas julia]|uniref:4'-phosphopantetheinyl transferase n=1 Tax=Rhodopseudomonas julia TaxID=200617 RepID=A0ABU0C7E8_9BRAD|nr:4'-phosphopantetheinyl transferase superfamily protein [Rhodopseudomonas julia]MDQ0325884.1 4'-phosphopantetheinyl transferase [Rhodopseudomonas julia]